MKNALLYLSVAAIVAAAGLFAFGQAKIAALPEITVTTAGTAVQVDASHLYVSSVTIQADPANTGQIFVEDSNLNVMAKITAGQSFTPPSAPSPTDLFTLYLDASANGQKAMVSYAK